MRWDENVNSSNITIVCGGVKMSTLLNYCIWWGRNVNPSDLSLHSVYGVKMSLPVTKLNILSGGNLPL